MKSRRRRLTKEDKVTHWEIRNFMERDIELIKHREAEKFPGKFYLLMAIFLIFYLFVNKGFSQGNDNFIIRIGVIGPLDYKQGIIQKRAIEYIIDNFNFNGIKIKAFYKDDKSDPKIAAEMAKQLIDEEKVSIIIGTINSSCSIAIKKIALERQTPVICAISTATIVTSNQTKDNCWLFRISIPDKTQMEFLVKGINNLSKEKEIKYIALFYESHNPFFSEVDEKEDIYGGGLKNDFLKSWMNIKGKEEPIFLPFNRNISAKKVHEIISNAKSKFDRKVRQRRLY